MLSSGLNFVATNYAPGGLNANTDPMSILSGNTGIDTGANSVFSLLDFGGLVYVLRTYGLVIGAIALVIDLVILMFVNRADMIAEKKQDLIHKVLIILLLVNVIPIAGVVMNFFQIIIYGSTP